MPLPVFEIENISPMITDSEPHYAIAEVVIRVSKDELNASDLIRIKLPFNYDESLSVSVVKELVFSEIKSTLGAAIELCDGNDLESLTKLRTSSPS